MKRVSGTNGLRWTSQSCPSWRRDVLTPLIVAVIVVAASFGASDSSAQNSKPQEYEVKATYLYNFARFVEWPAVAVEAKGNSFDVCVLGQDPSAPTLHAAVPAQPITATAVPARPVSKPHQPP